jgi:hypothetical protein
MSKHTDPRIDEDDVADDLKQAKELYDAATRNLKWFKYKIYFWWGVAA